jgi:hypothetical protein
LCGVGFAGFGTDPSATRIHSIIPKERMIVVRATPQSFESINQSIRLRGCRVSSERVKFASVEERLRRVKAQWEAHMEGRGQFGRRSTSKFVRHVPVYRWWTRTHTTWCRWTPTCPFCNACRMSAATRPSPLCPSALPTRLVIRPPIHAPRLLRNKQLRLAPGVAKFTVPQVDWPPSVIAPKTEDCGWN